MKDLIRVGAGAKPASLVFKHARVLDVFTCTVLEDMDVALWKDKIAGISREGYAGEREIDLAGKTLVPGLLDGHLHVESTMLTVSEFARCVVPHGTTTIIIDPHEIANVLGLDGIRYILESAKYQPLTVHVCLPSCVPATDLETAGSKLSAFDLWSFFQNKWVVGLAEMMNYPGVINGDKGVLEKIELAQSMGKRIDGHAPGLRGKPLNAYLAANVKSDHECISLEEAEEKLSRGMHIMIREGSLAQNMEDLLPLVNDRNHTRFMFVTDDRHPHTLRDHGHMDAIVRKAIRLGLAPEIAIKMASYNTAIYFKLESLGAIAPGYFADLAVVGDIKSFQVEMVFKNGEMVARDNRLLYTPPDRRDLEIRSTVNIKWLEPGDFSVPVKNGKLRVIEIIPKSLYTRELRVAPKIRGNEVVADPENDIAKIVVVDRHQARHVGVGFVRGFGLKSGAWAQTIAHDSHNVIAVGMNDTDLMKAIIRIRKIGGGIAVAENDAILEELPLPIAGLMSDKSFPEVTEAMDRLFLALQKRLGSPIGDPFMTLSFLALPVIPELKITDRGLVDVKTFRHVDRWVE
ncbi:adenine deaminase [bacterium]|nr:adenine deaminase [bacterium]